MHQLIERVKALKEEPEYEQTVDQFLSALEDPQEPVPNNAGMVRTLMPHRQAPVPLKVSTSRKLVDQWISKFQHDTGLDRSDPWMVCPTCDKAGCKRCNGTGFILNPKKSEVIMELQGYEDAIQATIELVQETQTVPVARR